MQTETAENGRPCPVCGSKEWELFADKKIDEGKLSEFTYSSRKKPEFMRLRLVCCRGCDLVYAPEPPNEALLERAYSEAAYDSGIEAKAAAMTYARVMEPYLKRHFKLGGAVDVGAGSGPLLPHLLAAGYEPVIGIEPSLAAVEAADEKVKPMLRATTFNEASIEDENLTLLCSFMTLEHVDNPGQLASCAFDFLAPGGIVAFVVHNWRAPLNRMLGMKSPIIDVEHLQLFSPRSLRTLVEGAGFRCIALKPISNKYPLRYWIRLLPLPDFLQGVLQKMISLLRIDKLSVPMRVGNMIAIAIKQEE